MNIVPDFDIKNSGDNSKTPLMENENVMMSPMRFME